MLLMSNTFHPGKQLSWPMMVSQPFIVGLLFVKVLIDAYSGVVENLTFFTWAGNI